MIVFSFNTSGVAELRLDIQGLVMKGNLKLANAGIVQLASARHDAARALARDDVPLEIGDRMASVPHICTACHANNTN
jgi:hypothetical protein